MIASCDPGYFGGLALLALDGRLVEVRDMPIEIEKVAGRLQYDDATGDVSRRMREEKDFDLSAIAGCLEEWRILHGADRFLIEKVGARPEQGSNSIFVFGWGAGAIEGAAAGAGYRRAQVPPQRWKPAMGCTADKAKSCERARLLFPDHRDEFRLVKHNGRAEAALIGLYGARHPELWP